MGSGNFVWCDLMATDREAAIAFYTATVGWGTETWDVGGTPYTMFQPPNGPAIGGVDAAPDGQTQYWLCYISAADCDATTAQAVAMGATIRVPPTDIPTVGRFAIVVDPWGAVFAPFTSASPSDSAPKVELGGLGWSELATDDVEAAFAFYSALFGWQKTSAMDMDPSHGIYQMFGLGDRSLGGMFRQPPPRGWLTYWLVADLEAAIARAKAGGGVLISGPQEVPGGDHVAELTDPQGGRFALYQRG